MPCHLFRFFNTRRLATLFVLPLAIAVATVSLGDRSFADDAKPDAKPEASKAAEPAAEIPAEPAVKKVKLSGVFVADQATELTTGADKLGALKIEKLVAHGTSVKQGENVVWLESKAADEKIQSAEVDLQLAQLALENAEFEFKQFLELQKLDRNQIERDRQVAQQRYDNFVKVDRQRQIELAKFSLKSAEASLDNVREELNQLTQMYEEDDLTEESEEIVLRRSREAVEAAEFRLEGTKTQTERVINQQVPRESAEQEDAIAKARFTFQSAVEKQKNDRRKKEIELGKQREATSKQSKEFETLRNQRKQIVLTAPHDGMVIHGPLTNGKIADKESPLQVGSSVSDTQVIATIVNPNRLHVVVGVPESDFANLSVADEVTVVPGIDGEQTIKGTIKSISSLPTTGTKFEAIVTIPRLKDSLVLPATTCSVEMEIAADEETAAVSPSDQKTDSKQPEKKSIEKKTDEKKSDEKNSDNSKKEGKS